MLVPSCTPRRVVVERAPQAYYQTGFPFQDTSRDLERIARSIKGIHFTGEYRVFVFTKEAAVTDADDFLDPAILARAADTLTETESKRGTATILTRAARGIALLTNHHVVHYPPVAIQYFDERRPATRSRDAPRPIASVAVRVRERGALSDHPELGAFEVVARDSPSDLALLEVPIRDPAAADRFSPIPVLAGHPGRLSWGSFVYVLGYPRGYRMVTFGIVSDPNRDRHDAFLLNGLWNEGISGGPIMAIRGETGDLEWVGIARAGAGEIEMRLAPRAAAAVRDEDLPLLYEGPLILESIQRIQYGITFSVPLTAVRAFVDRQRQQLTSRGYDVPRF